MRRLSFALISAVSVIAFTYTASAADLGHPIYKAPPPVPPPVAFTLADDLGSGLSFAINTKQSVDTIKGRISYLFSIH